MLQSISNVFAFDYAQKRERRKTKKQKWIGLLLYRPYKFDVFDDVALQFLWCISLHFIAFPLFVGFFPFGLCSFRFVLYVGLTNKTKALDDPNIRRFEDIFTIFVSRQGSHKKRIFEFELLSLPFVVTLLVLKAFITTGGTSVHWIFHFMIFCKLPF